MDADPTTHWARWHADYDNPSSALSQRLTVVSRRLCEAIALTIDDDRLVQLISVCAGQGHDVVGALRDNPHRHSVSGHLVELDTYNCQVAREALSSASLSAVGVVQGDASKTDINEDLVPASVILLCGVFGNVADDDVHNTIATLSRLCTEGALVLWTRHRRVPDLTPKIRQWFTQNGYEELHFDSPDDQLFAVGMHKLVVEPLPFLPGVQLFTFTDP
jgi:hypothetical protein